ncbi:MAG: ATP-binding protein [Chloroflexota bacterium]
MRSISLKLILAFLTTSLLGILGLAISLGWATNRAFEKFVFDQNRDNMVDALAQHYLQYGNWDQVGSFVPGPAFTGEREPGSGVPFVLVGKDGEVIRGGYQHPSGQVLPPEMLAGGLPILVDGETVGTLIFTPNPIRENSPERAFMERNRQAILFSGLAAALVALVLGIVLSRTISRPIQELTRATQAISQGALGRQVAVRTRDELGQLAQSFNQMSADLDRSIRTRKQMTADIAHELRTPLSVILGHADAVHDGVLPPTRENFEIIRDEAERLEHIVEDLRVLSLADAGELTLSLHPVKPAGLLRDVITAHAPRARQKDIRLELEPGPALPEIRVDAGRITQVLGNLLDNALRHTPADGTILLAARPGPDEGTVALLVEDTGPGVPDEDLPRLFDRLYRSDSSRQRDAGGSGLGLAIARSIVQAHGGNIYAENRSPNGLRVVVVLPAKRD